MKKMDVNIFTYILGIMSIEKSSEIQFLFDPVLVAWLRKTVKNVTERGVFPHFPVMSVKPGTYFFKTRSLSLINVLKYMST